MRLCWIALAAALACGPLAGCKTLRGLNSCNKPQPYLGSGSVPPLKIPAGMDAFDTSNSLKLPTLNEPAPPARSARDPCLDAPPSFKAPTAPTPQA
ncbi:MAG: hypothetical protein JO341_05645 [Gammaproteobacteria bacterium]|nr:hypothetical protein [Gammaproteobacteria bacterium]MBV9620488.1 hypothetical protein [Gammaproteobacteria bacterium]